MEPVILKEDGSNQQTKLPILPDIPMLFQKLRTELNIHNVKIALKSRQTISSLLNNGKDRVPRNI